MHLQEDSEATNSDGSYLLKKKYWVSATDASEVRIRICPSQVAPELAAELADAVVGQQPKLSVKFLASSSALPGPA